MAVMEPLRESPSCRIRIRRSERCCSRALKISGKGYLQSEHMTTLGLYRSKRKPATAPLLRRAPINADARRYGCERLLPKDSLYDQVQINSGLACLAVV